MALLRCELQPARGGHADAADLRHHDTNAFVADPLLGNSQRILILPAFGVDQALWREAGLRERRREQVMARQHP